MTALDELFMNDKERAENKLPKIFDIPLSEIDDFPDHPYRVLDDEDMQNLMESIRDRGIYYSRKCGRRGSYAFGFAMSEALSHKLCNLTYAGRTGISACCVRS